jgi:hypothetical protein
MSVLFNKETEKGILRYRMPNILESYDILECSGITEGKPSQLKMKRNIIASMGYLLDFSEIEEFKSYDDLLNDTECMIVPLGEIADEVIVKAFSAFKKKSS